MVDVDAQDLLFDGLTKHGMDDDARDVFEGVYRTAGASPHAVVVQHFFKLVNPATGRESEGVVARYRITREQADQIDWDNATAVEWDLYRTFLHPDLQ